MIISRRKHQEDNTNHIVASIEVIVISDHDVEERLVYSDWTSVELQRLSQPESSWEF